MSTYTIADMNSELNTQVINLILEQVNIDDIPQAPNALRVEATKSMIEQNCCLEGEYIIVWKNTKANNIKGLGYASFEKERSIGLQSKRAEYFLEEFGGQLIVK